MSAHTPGPWKVEKCGCVVGQNNQTICHSFTHCAEFTSNARLIAAAPELLEQRNELLAEAKRLVALIKDWPSIHKEGDYLHDGALIGIRAAIARAEKGQP